MPMTSEEFDAVTDYIDSRVDLLRAGMKPGHSNLAQARARAVLCGEQPQAEDAGKEKDPLAPGWLRKSIRDALDSLSVNARVSAEQKERFARAWAMLDKSDVLRRAEEDAPNAAISQDAELPVRRAPIAGPAVDAFNRGEGRDELAAIVGRACDAAMKHTKSSKIEVTREQMIAGNTALNKVYSDGDEMLAAVYRAMRAAEPTRPVTDDDVSAAVGILVSRFNSSGVNSHGGVRAALEDFAKRRGI